MKQVQKTAKKRGKNQVRQLSEARDICREKLEQATVAKLKMYKALMKQKVREGASPTKVQDEVLDDPPYRVLVDREADALAQLQAANTKLTEFSMSVMLRLHFRLPTCYFVALGEVFLHVTVSLYSDLFFALRSI